MMQYPILQQCKFKLRNYCNSIGTEKNYIKNSQQNLKDTFR